MSKVFSRSQGQEESRMETLGLAEVANGMEECASTSAVTPNYLTPMQSNSSCSDHSGAEAASLVYYSTRIEGLSELRSKFDNQLEFEVESSKSHWTELSAATANSDDSDVQVPNSVVFEEMKQHPLWGPLFQRQLFTELKIGAKIAEGGQAEIFEALGRMFSGDKERRLVLKVFKKGYSLVDLQRSWPPALALPSIEMSPHVDVFCRNQHAAYDSLFNYCWVVGVHMMNDERFAFIFRRYWGDLRKLIDEEMLERNGFPPLDCFKAYTIIKNIAQGMWFLHAEGILHNDLKAANVLVSDRLRILAIVADFESSRGIVGRGFWRAPEILLALKNCNLKQETFMQQMDVYSFAMTCYEVIMGHMPFEGHDKCDYDMVLRGERPTLPSDLPYSIFNNLVTRCWHQDPRKRPSFAEILLLKDLEGMDAEFLRKKWTL